MISFAVDREELFEDLRALHSEFKEVSKPSSETISGPTYSSQLIFGDIALINPEFGVTYQLQANCSDPELHVAIYKSNPSSRGLKPDLAILRKDSALERSFDGPIGYTSLKASDFDCKEALRRIVDLSSQSQIFDDFESKNSNEAFELTVECRTEKVRRPIRQEDVVFKEKSQAVKNVLLQYGILLVAIGVSGMFITSAMISVVTFLIIYRNTLSLFWSGHLQEYILYNIKPSEDPFDTFFFISLCGVKVVPAKVRSELAVEEKGAIYASETSRKICETVDSLMINRQHEEVFDELSKFVRICTPAERSDVEFLWRWARAHTDLAVEVGPVDSRYQTLAVKCLDIALEAEKVMGESNNFHVLKTLAISYGQATDFQSVKQQIASGKRVYETAMEAHRMRPGDFLVCYILGRFHFRIAGLSRFERLASRGMGFTVPCSSYDDSLGWFMKSYESFSEFIPTLYFIAKCHKNLSNRSGSRKWLEKAKLIRPKSRSDRQFLKRIDKLRNGV
eukprot:172630_1